MKNELKAIRKSPNKDLIAHVESLLRKAKNGSIQSIVEVVVFENGATANGCSISDTQMLKMSIIVAEVHMMLIRLANHDTGIFRDIEILKDK